MQLGMIGLGRMGANMVRRLQNAGHSCVVHDHNVDKIATLAAEGSTPAMSLTELVEQLVAPRTVCIMIAAAHVDAAIDELAPLLEPGDTIIDGGNTLYHRDIERAARLRPRMLHYIDMGTSGGVWGRERGYCLMIGGEAAAVQRLDPIFSALAPGRGDIPATPGRADATDTADRGYFHCGPAGAGHFVKMVHNGIEYGLMAAYAEGFNILHRANIGAENRPVDAETTPLVHPEHYQYDLDLPAIAELWRRGSVISSWLLDLSAQALVADPGLEAYAGRVSDSGEGRWTIQAAIDEAVPAHVLTAALMERFASRGEDLFQNRVLSAMRAGFGGHVERKA